VIHHMRRTWYSLVERVPQRNLGRAAGFLLFGCLLAAYGLFVGRGSFLVGMPLIPMAPFLVGLGVCILLIAAVLALPNHRRREKLGLYVAASVLAIGILAYVVLVLLLGVIASLV
jgi:4-amino-4-deoxy-L-arabinose transferase-like glycosyltransferase